jgi:SOS-response transcriptional repressor LexA
MFESKNSLELTHILSRLMANKGLKERDLVKTTGLPYTTVANILRGKSKNPRPHTLKVLADLFGITIEQLIGYETLETTLPSASSKRSLDFLESRATSLIPLSIPLIKWNDVKSWISGQRAIKTHTIWIVNDTCKSPKAFALKAKPSMPSYSFYTEATFLIDPQEPIRDGLVALVFLDGSREPSLRKVVVEGEKQWLQPLEKGIPPVVLSSKHLVVGPVVQVRYDPRVG